MTNKQRKTVFVGAFTMTMLTMLALPIKVSAEIRTNDLLVHNYMKEFTVGFDAFSLESVLVANEKNNEIRVEVIEYDLPETIYDVFTENEQEIFFRIVEAEATGLKLSQKINVANVILNRIDSDKFPNTMKEVVFADGQFSPIGDGRYFEVEITKETIKACEKAFEEKDTTKGSLYFDCAKNSWASNNKEFVFSDKKHCFYK